MYSTTSRILNDMKINILISKACHYKECSMSHFHQIIVAETQESSEIKERHDVRILKDLIAEDKCENISSKTVEQTIYSHFR